IWNTAMWYFALPTSSSHAMVGGMIGAMWIENSSRGIPWPMFSRIFLLLGLVPLGGVVFGLVLSKTTYWLGEYMTPAAKTVFRWLQIVALAGVSLVHGNNDGQKAVAMVVMGLSILIKRTPQVHHLWLIFLFSGVAMALGVIFGSRRIIRTLGRRLYRLE